MTIYVTTSAVGQNSVHVVGVTAVIQWWFVMRFQASGKATLLTTMAVSLKNGFPGPLPARRAHRCMMF